MNTIAQRLAAQYPATNAGMTVEVAFAPARLRGRRQQSFARRLRLGAILVLLIACANVANLTLARASTREREIAVRLAVGGSRWQIVRLLLSESLLIALIGGALGVLLAFWAVDAFKAIGAGVIARIDEIGVDLPVLIFSAGDNLRRDRALWLVAGVESGAGESRTGIEIRRRAAAAAVWRGCAKL